MSALQPPRINTTDPNQQEVSDNSDDHFSSASEGSDPSNITDGSQSPIPITRVERVDDSAAHGEIPGTPAYDQRMADAVPDEVEIVPEIKGHPARSRSSTMASGSRSRSHSQLGEVSRPQTPGGTPIPRTVVDKVDFSPRHGEVEGTPAKEMRMADAMPDEIRAAPASSNKRIEGRLRDGASECGEADVEDESEEGRQAWFRSMWEGKQHEQNQDPWRDNVRAEAIREEAPTEDEVFDEDEDRDDDFGDDFDAFAEGDEDADFGDFDEAADEPPTYQEEESQSKSEQTPAAPDILAGLPPIDLAHCNTPAEIQEAIQPYINAILPNSAPVDLSPPSETSTSPFLSDRSLSLWQQLVSPPPMQPPNWTRSRIRRLFLVSLGVPVDLDEILPPSKQKRLILPSIGLSDSEGPYPPAVERLRENDNPANSSTTSLDSKTGQSKPRKTRTVPSKGPPPPPDFDTISAARLAATTEEALSIYGDAELKEHILTLEILSQQATKVLEYWLLRRDEGLKEKEALEGVIENLVGFVKGRRKGGR